MRDGTRRCPSCGGVQDSGNATRVNQDCQHHHNTTLEFDSGESPAAHPDNSVSAALLDFLLRFRDYHGRTGRKEYWITVAVLAVVGSILGLVLGEVSGVLYFFLLFPGLAMTVRRLRDAGQSPWHCLWLLLFPAGWIILLVLLVKPGRG